jgi:hypothetical protein
MDVVRRWLDGQGALNLHTGEASPAPDPLMVAAAKMMVGEACNGLSSGHGKDSVVQLVRAFAAEGHRTEVDPSLRAYFAAGGSFRHAESVAKLVKEMRARSAGSHFGTATTSSRSSRTRSGLVNSVYAQLSTRRFRLIRPRERPCQDRLGHARLTPTKR